MRRDGEGFQLTLHVRVMHALVNETFTPRWDVARWGLPINQSDQAATLGLFSGVLVLGSRALGARITPDESRAVMHLWKYIGWLMGVDDAWLVDTEREQHRLNYHILIAQAGISEAGPRLAQAIVDGAERPALRPVRAPRSMDVARAPAEHADDAARAAAACASSACRCGRPGPSRTSWRSTSCGTASSAARRGGSATCSGGATAVAARVMYRHFGPDRPEIGTLDV